jgi:hypothetical protein
MRESGNLVGQQNGDVRGADAGLDKFVSGGFNGIAASVQRKDGPCLGYGSSPLRQRILVEWARKRGSDSMMRVL